MSNPSPSSTPLSAVARLSYPLTAVGELPQPLLSAFNVAVFQVEMTHQAILAAGWKDRELFLASWNGVRSETDPDAALRPVLNELLIAADPGRSFAAGCAHQAAVRLGTKLIWDVPFAVKVARGGPFENPSWVPSDDDIRCHFQAVREAVIKLVVPDRDELVAALQREAAKAASLFRGRTEPHLRPDSKESEDATGAKPDPFAELRPLLVDLSGQERAVVEALLNAGGHLRLADLAIKQGVNWKNPFEQFKGVKRRLQGKSWFATTWQLNRKHNTAYLSMKGLKRG